MTVRILTGDCRCLLPTLASESVQMCCSSPPYWGLRDYGVPNQLGLEDDPRDYIGHLVDTFREVARVLRPDGTLWLNMGDCYTDGGRGPDLGSTLQGSRKNQGESRKNNIREKAKPFGLGRKQLIGMPWRVAFALQDDGWVLRSDIVWHKPNPMPESCGDRPTKAHEYFFLFSKQRFYYYDRHAIAEPASSTSHARGSGVGPKARIPSGWDDREGSNHHGNLGRYSEHRKTKEQSRARGKNEESGHRRYAGFNERWEARLRGKQNASYSGAIADLVATRNSRSVWRIPTAPYKGAHFATFPPALAERAILAGSSPHACCRCGAPYDRVIEPPGWTAGCECVPPVVGRSTVLDPFAGAGTTGLVADRLGRDAILIELSPSYSQMARDRIDQDAPLLAETQGA